QQVMIQKLKIPKLIRWIFSTGIIFLLLMTLSRIALYLFFNHRGYHLSTIFPSFVLGLRYDIKIICFLLLLMLLTGLFPFLNPFKTDSGREIWLNLMGVAAFLFMFFYSIDFAHYGYLRQRLSASVLNYLSDASISMKMVWQTYPVLRIILLLIAGTWFIRWMIVASYKRIKKNAVLTTKRNTVLWWIFTFLLLALGVFGRIGQYPLRWSDAFDLGSDYKAHVALNPFQSFFSSLKFRHTSYNLARVKQAFPILAPYFGFIKSDTADFFFERQIQPTGAPLPVAPNVVVVICESFSAYKSSMWGNPLDPTPFFNQMSKKGIFFDHCFTPTYGTARGVWAIITGMPDVEIETTTSSRNPDAVDQHTIINSFTGYEKFYFLGGSASWANIRGLLTNNIKGLRLFEQQNYDAPKVDVWGISDKNLFLEANKVLRDQKQPFFAIIQTADNHRPYTIPAEDLKDFQTVRFSSDSLRKFGFESNDELNAFRYTDFGYQKFIEAAQKENYFGNTIFLFIGDHGIPGDAGNMFPRAWTDQRLTAMHVPLLIYGPKFLSPKRIGILSSQVDVLPTLAGICRKSYLNTTFGRDLLDSGFTKDKALAFIYDPDQRFLGVIKDGYFFRKQMQTGREEIVSIENNEPFQGTPSEKSEWKAIAEGIYETSKWMLFHNKKR
ncbi:MAG: hypothetical protein C5B59_13855, partial [Bacteroidetes bacterium]